MPTSLRVDRAYSGTSKFLYTPVLYGNVPESSTSSTDEAGPSSTYLKRLMREHLARASLEEVMSSESDAPSPEFEARVVRLTEKVKRAYLESNGNPADGRWAVISDLLRLHSTSGGRNWIGANLDVRAPEIPKHLCEIPRTSEEWQELEHRLKGTEQVKFKVQKWIATAEFEPLTPDATIVQDHALTNRTSPPPDSSHFQEKYKGPRIIEQATLKTVSSGAGLLSSGSKFGFNVVKRPNAVIKDKPKPKDVLPPPSHSPAPAEFPAPPIVQDEARPSAISSNGKSQSSIPVLSNVADASDSNLHPLSFRPSQIETSTPVRHPGNHPPEEGLILSSPIRKSSPNARNVFSQPQRHSASPKPEPSRSQGRGAAMGKREGSSLQEETRRAKRPRTTVDNSSHLQNPPSQFGDANIRAPPRENLPVLTELIESPACNATNTPKKGCSKTAHDLSTSNGLPESEDQFPSSVAREVPSANGSTIMLGVNNPSPDPESRNTIHAMNTIFDEERRSLNHGPEPSSEPAPTSNAIETIAPYIPPAKDALVDGSPSQLHFKSLVAVESHSDADISIEEALIVQESRPHTPQPISPREEPFRFPSNGLESLSPNEGAMSYQLYGLDELDSSPVKSLSSLAGSDSGSDEVDEKTSENVSLSKYIDIGFNPPFTSTQKPGLRYPPALNAPMTSNNQSSANEKLPSTSQLQAEVNNQVNKFDKFMEADLGYDLVVPGQ